MMRSSQLSTIATDYLDLSFLDFPFGDALEDVSVGGVQVTHSLPDPNGCPLLDYLLG